MQRPCGHVPIPFVVIGVLAAGCGGSTLSNGGSEPDATTKDSGHVVTSGCVPGQSAACVGPGGCATNQVCKTDGSGFGACTCSPSTVMDASADAARAVCASGASVACTGPGGCKSNQVCNTDGSGFGPCTCAGSTDAAADLCVPGKSIACAGAGGCISSQVCNGAGNGYGPCACGADGGTALLCIPGQSVSCGGPYGCPSFQICNDTGRAYGPCDCPDAASFVNDAGELPDGYAPLPPPVGDQGYNALWAYVSNWGAPGIYLPLFSAPDCAVNPPFGEFFFVIFEPAATGPAGTLPSCPGLGMGSSEPCYSPALGGGADGQIFEGGSGLTYTVSAFDSNGIPLCQRA